jgi:UDP-glucose 4-epimerase
VSTYGASKLAGEALISSYCQMFGLTGCVFRFGNIVGPHQTHGVGYDFIRRLIAAPSELTILGDGHQTKSYIYVDDVIDAILIGAGRAPDPFTTFNVATVDYVTVTEIAHLAIAVLGLPPAKVTLHFSGGDRGWKGDVPVVRLNTGKIRALGWSNRLPTRAALRLALESMAQDVRAGRIEG